MSIQATTQATEHTQPDVPSATGLAPSGRPVAQPEIQIQDPGAQAVPHVIATPPMPISVRIPSSFELRDCALISTPQDESIDPQLRTLTVGDAEDASDQGTDSESGYGSDSDEGSGGNTNLAKDTVATRGKNKGKKKKPTAEDPFHGHVDGLGRGNSGLHTCLIRYLLLSPLLKVS